MAFSFERYVQKSDEFLQEVAEELGYPEDTEKAFRVFRSVTHTIRDNITPEENLHLISQLPMMIKATYLDNWKITDDNIRHRDAFLERVQEYNTTNNQRDLHTPDQTADAIQKVFNVLKRHVSKGEIDDVLSMLPKEVKPLMS